MTEKKINVLQFICPTGFYGAERWILALANHLPKDSTRCDLAVTLEKDSNDLMLVKKYREDCGEVFELPMTHRFDFSVVKKLVDLIKKRNIDIIHTHGYKSDILGLLASRKAGIRHVVTPHGFENSADIKLKFFIWLGCKAMSFADVVVPLSRQLMNDSKNAGVPNRKLFYLQNGVDLSEVDSVRKSRDCQKPIAEKRIGIIGQLISRKNIFDILDIFDDLAADHDSVHLMIVGDGDQRAELEAYAEKLDNHNKIEFLGFRQDRLELLKSFDLFVMTSTLEGIPRCLMEACAMEIPVAAYNIPGIDQLITHEETGLLAAPGDKKTLKSYCERLLYNESEAHQIAEKARIFVQANFSAKRMADQYMDLFSRLV